LPESSAQRAALGYGGGVELTGETAAFAVIGLGEIDEFEIEGEGASELIGGGQAEAFDTTERVRERVGGRSRARLGGGTWRGTAISVRAGVVDGFAVGDRGLAKLFDGFEDGHAGLLAQNFAEQHAERTDIAAERDLFQVASGC
jgi:hypothetical protein